MGSVTKEVWENVIVRLVVCIKISMMIVVLKYNKREIAQSIGFAEN